MHAKVDLNGIFDIAVRRGLVDSNPIPGRRALVTIPKSESKAALTLAQIRTFFAKLAMGAVIMVLAAIAGSRVVCLRDSWLRLGSEARILVGGLGALTSGV